MTNKFVVLSLFVLVGFASSAQFKGATSQPLLPLQSDQDSNKTVAVTTLVNDVTTEVSTVETEGSKTTIQNDVGKELELMNDPGNHTTDAPITVGPETTTVDPKPTTTVDPNNTTTVEPNTTTVEPNNTTTVEPNTTTVNPNTTTVDPNTTTVAPTPDPKTTTSNPNSTTVEPATTTSNPDVKPRRFDGASFIGGMVLAIGLMCIGLVAWKFYRARTERNYHTL